jgi:hypothetical protein
MVVASCLGIHWYNSLDHVAQKVSYHLVIEAHCKSDLAANINAASLLEVVIRPLDGLVDQELVEDRALDAEKAKNLYC